MSSAASTQPVSNPDHHLWNNHGTWWVHATVLHRGLVQERLRRSLGTRELGEARARRDAFLAELAKRIDLQLSIRVGRPHRLARSGGTTALSRRAETFSEVRPSKG